MQGVLENLSAAQKKLAEVRTAQDALDLIKMADAAAYLARELDMGTGAVNLAVVIKAKTMRRLADIVDKGQARGEIARPGHQPNVRGADICDLPVPRQRLAECRTMRDKYTDHDLDKLTDCDEELSTRQLIRQPPHISNNSGENEWYTPGELTDLARKAMGGIDLDPASSPEANQIIGATQFYTAADNGLVLPWKGRVWLNPPYARNLITRFVDRLVTEWQRENITAACLLVNNATETEWWQQAAAVCSWACFLRGRVKFWQPGGQSSAPLQGQAILGFGCDSEPFDSTGIVFR